MSNDEVIKYKCSHFLPPFFGAGILIWLSLGAKFYEKVSVRRHLECTVVSVWRWNSLESKPLTLIPQDLNLNPQPQTWKPKPLILNPKPETPNTKSAHP